MATAVPSKNQVNKAGKVLRAFIAGELVRVDASDAALRTLLAFRAAHQYPLIKATMGLRSSVATEGCIVEVSQRLKRVPTILDKLVRYPEMELARMQDIGGCRAVLGDVAEVRRVERRIHRNNVSRTSSSPRVTDYISNPRSSGYRGVHVIVEYDGRAIEMQLRTQVMHEWAIAVEQLSGRVQADLKSNIGPREVLDWLEAVSEAMATEERGSVVDEDRLARLNGLRTAAVRYLGGGRP